MAAVVGAVVAVAAAEAVVAAGSVQLWSGQDPAIVLCCDLGRTHYVDALI